MSSPFDVFAIVYKDDETGEFTVRAYDGGYVSRLIDEQDIASLEEQGIAGIYAPGKDGSLQPVVVGDQHRINTDEEMPFRYASAPLTTTDGTIAGYVTYTDH